MAFSLVQLLRDHAQSTPERPALELGDTVLSYGALYERSRAVAQVLVDDGVKRGERVAVLAQRSFDSYAAIFGVMMAQGIYVPLNSAAPTAQHDAILQDCQITRLVGDRSLENVSIFGQSLGLVVGPSCRSAATRIVSWHEVDQAAGSGIDLPINEQDPCLIFYTSGSTGRPKGIVHSHRSMLSNVEWAVRRFGLGPEDRFSNVTSHHFDLCWFEMYASIAAGGMIRISPDDITRFPYELAHYYAGSKITVWCSVPSTLMQLAARGSLDPGDFSDLRWVLFAGERFPTKNLKDLMRLLPGPRYCNMYGTSETHIAAYLPLPTVAELSDNPLPIGSNCEHVELEVFRPDGSRASAGEVGELAIRGPSVMEGYWRLPERTVAVLRRHPIGDEVDGLFYHTGDLVTRREDGIIEVIGRADRRVKVSGVLVDLDEVEAVLLSQPDIRECAVFQAEAGGVIEAVAIPTEAGHPQAAALRAKVAERLPLQAVPQRIAIVTALPRTGSAKISRAEIPEFFARHIAETSVGTGNLVERLRDFLETEVFRDPLPPNFSDEEELLESGRLQSLDVVRVVGFIEENLGLSIPNEAFNGENFRSIAAMNSLLSYLSE
jgi:amino acid adenylation domain-containing protein